MKLLYLFIFIVFTFNACSVKYKNVDIQNRKVINKSMINLSDDIKKLSKEINEKESINVSYDAITYSKFLANKYEVIKPALFHNTLVNLNLKEKGYCYHYANDLMKYLEDKKYKSFYFQKVVANRGEYFEHNSLILTRDDVSFENSIVLDAWRDSGILFWSKVKDDKRYKWEKR
ncbi:MAG: hypothetical protein C0625_13585 [Arcobacter sp.]|nr:MAG: hypothetical protein C0625_13585 [Arcobacter sp.]